MKRMLKNFFSLAALLSTVSAYSVVSMYSIRNQGQDAARDLAGMTQHINLFDMDKIYGTFAVTAEYTQSFKPNRIAESLFGPAVCNSGCNGATIGVSGSRVATRGANDWLADNFYLPTDYQSTLRFSPRIRNAVVDLDFYLGLDEWACGLYLRVNAPIVWTSWNLNFCEDPISTGSLNYGPGYFNTYDVAPAAGALNGIGIRRANLLPNFAAYAAGGSTGAITDTPLTTTQSVVYDPLCYAKFDGCKHNKTALADLAVTLGYNFINDEDYHLGVGLRVLAPTGTRPNAKLLFEPIVGNGKHWELGADVSGHAMLWRSADEESNLGFFVDANITHLFKAKQRRTADLAGKPMSRYMLAERLATGAVATVGGLTTTAATAATAPTAPTAIFAGEFAPVANLTTQDVRVSVGVQGDVAAQFTYTRCGFAMDLGYNFWGRSCEKVACPSSCNTTCISSSSGCSTGCSSSAACTTTPFAANTWALKGDAYVYGFNSATGAAVALSATESLATINAGTNFGVAGVASTNTTVIAADRRNPSVDNAQFAYAGVAAGAVAVDATLSGPAPADQTHTSINPVFIDPASFNYSTNRGISNKIYTNLSYNWVDCEDWVPYVGVGGFGEFGNGGKCNSGCSSSSSAACPTTNTCSSSSGCSSSCESAALSQWGVWAKFGVSFN